VARSLLFAPLPAFQEIAPRPTVNLNGMTFSEFGGLYA
jgi:hypothetical protein